MTPLLCYDPNYGMTPHEILGPPLNLAPPNLIFCTGPLQLFWSEIFRSPLKLGGEGCYHEWSDKIVTLDSYYIRDKLNEKIKTVIIRK